ncbi:uncharacterized protein [Littorina saxatilis]|uniref:EF-hand domain-containing protein n=1 Tax=Littorina saxatilis TaxID=31220 RepID=A0AAN9B5R5_9CAEN
MMTKTFLVLLIVCAVLVADSDCWRRRRRRRGGFLRRVARIVKSYVAGKVVGAAVGSIGKRDALCADLLTPEQAKQLATDLQNTCAAIPVNLAADGLNFDEIKGIFTDSDVDGDGKLLAAELADFSAAIQTTEACAEVETEAENEIQT